MAAEKEELLRTCVGAVELDGLPKAARTGDLTGDVAVRTGELAQRIAARLDELIALRREIETAIERLPDSRDRQLMRLRYIEGKKWEQIAVEMSYDYRWVLRMHGRILEWLKSH